MYSVIIKTIDFRDTINKEPTERSNYYVITNNSITSLHITVLKNMHLVSDSADDESAHRDIDLFPIFQQDISYNSL